MSRKFLSNLTAPERLITVTVVALAVIAFLAFVISRKDDIISMISPDEEVHAPLSFDTPHNISAKVVEVDPDARTISVDSDIEDVNQAGTFTTKRLSIQTGEDTEFEKFNVAQLHLAVPAQTLTVAELEPGASIVVSSKDNPQAVSIIQALAVRQYVR